jgi:hypothetical protein
MSLGEKYVLPLLEPRFLGIPFNNSTDIAKNQKYI